MWFCATIEDIVISKPPTDLCVFFNRQDVHFSVDESGHFSVDEITAALSLPVH